MNRVFFAASRRVIGALSLAACAVTLAAGCTSSASPTPVPTAAGGSGPSANADAAGGGGGASSSAMPTSSAVAGASGSGSASGGAGSGSGLGGSGGVGGGSAPAASAKAQAGGGSSTCVVRYLHASTGLSQGAMGSTYVNIVFKNLNNAPCTLSGYPGVSLGAGTPVDQVGQPAARDNSVVPKVITLAPGGYAYATLRVTDVLNYPAVDCKPSPTSWLLVYPPNTSNLLYVAYKSNACTTDKVTMSVQAVQAGNGGG